MKNQTLNFHRILLLWKKKWKSPRLAIISHQSKINFHRKMRNAYYFSQDCYFLCVKPICVNAKKFSSLNANFSGNVCVKYVLRFDEWTLGIFAMRYFCLFRLKVKKSRWKQSKGINSRSRNRKFFKQMMIKHWKEFIYCGVVQLVPKRQLKIFFSQMEYFWNWSLKRQWKEWLGIYFLKCSILFCFFWVAQYFWWEFRNA